MRADESLNINITERPNVTTTLKTQIPNPVTSSDACPILWPVPGK